MGVPHRLIQQLLASAETALKQGDADACRKAIGELSGRGAPRRNILSFSARLCLLENKLTAAMEAWDDLVPNATLTASEWRAYAETLFAAGRIGEAFDALGRLGGDPRHRLGYLLSAVRFHSELDMEAVALGYCEQALVEAGESERAFEAHLARAGLREAIGDAAGATADFVFLTQAYPDAIKGRAGLIRCLIDDRALAAARYLLEGLERRFAGRETVLELQAVLANIELDESGLPGFCEKRLVGDDISDATAVRVFKLLVKGRGFRLSDGVNAAFKRVFEPNPVRRKKIVAALAEAENPLAAAERLLKSSQRTLDAMDPAAKRGPMGVSLRARIAETLVQLGRPAEAVTLADALRRDTAAWPGVPHRVARALEWLSVREGDFDAAFQSFRSRSAIVRPRDRTGELVPVRNPAGRAGIVLFAQARNETANLKGFLDHHRSIGVERFVIVDNGSADGGFEFLCEQEDVELYRTFGGFRRAGAGNDWLIPLMSRHGDALCLRLDADERLVYPGMAGAKLADVARYMRQNGCNALRGVMIDVWEAGAPEGMGERETPAQRFLFDSAGHERIPSIASPYGDWYGGISATILGGRGVLISKVPVILGGDTVIPEGASRHRSSPAMLADFSVGLIHRKFNEAFAKKIDEEIARKEYDGAAQEYVRYKRVLSDASRARESGRLEALTSLKQLRACGLVVTSERWDAFAVALGAAEARSDELLRQALSK